MRHYFVIGSGLMGCTVSRLLADRGHKVTVIERRSHIGGNLFDEKDSRGFLIQKYGPHAFHTNNEKVWEFVNRFCRWENYRLCCGAFWDGKFTPTPFNFKTVDDFFPEEKTSSIKSALKSAFPGRKTVTVSEALNSSDALVREYAQYLFDNDYSLYTAKQWNVSTDKIDKSILDRVPLRLSYDEGYFDDKYQALPEGGYTCFIEKLLDSENIDVKLNTDALSALKIWDNKLSINGEQTEDTVIYTGAADELFGCCFGRLPYRSLTFDIKYDAETSDFQKYPIVAYPKEQGYTRITEFPKLPVQSGKGTVYAYEYPVNYEPGVAEPYYPVLTEESKSLYGKYLSLAEPVKNLVLCGRLADFKYYNMDQAVERGFQIAQRLLYNPGEKQNEQ